MDDHSVARIDNVALPFCTDDFSTTFSGGIVKYGGSVTVTAVRACRGIVDGNVPLVDAVGLGELTGGDMIDADSESMCCSC